MRHLIWIFAFGALSYSNVSFAQNYIDGANAALSEQNGTVSDLIHVDLAQRTQIALNSLVQAANDTLTQKGYAQEAQQYQKEWDANFSGYFLNFQLFDLGDHQPLNPWLADFYKKLQDRLGDPILKLLHLDDINTMNYAIPVVFQPRGDKRNGDHWDQAEYGRHFVPFSEVLVYWSSYIGCRIATRTFIKFKKYCGIAASTLRHLTGSMIAPKLSNHVYQAMTNHKNDQFLVDFGKFNPMAQERLNQIPQQ